LRRTLQRSVILLNNDCLLLNKEQGVQVSDTTKAR